VTTAWRQSERASDGNRRGIHAAPTRGRATPGMRSIVRPADVAMVYVSRALRAIALVGATQVALAQIVTIAANAEARVVMSSTIQAEPGADIALMIEVTPVASAPDKSFIRIKGLPAAAALSDGHVIAPGSWAIALDAVPTLRLKLPARQSGRSDLTVTLVGLNGLAVAETRASLIVAGLPDSANSLPLTPVASAVNSLVPKALAMAPPSVAAGLAASVPTPPPIIPAPIPVSRPPVVQELPPLPSASKPTLTADETTRAQRYVQRGQQELTDGNVAAARLLFRRAADMGYPSGTLALASTYDPAELARIGAFTIQGDVAEARRWYEKAMALGSTEADGLLKRLGNR
jgi:hypothetical protein